MLTATQPSRTRSGGVDRTTVRVVDKTPVADGVVTLTLAAPDGGRLPDWSPGAHVDLTLDNGLTRQYSLCGDRWDAHTYRVGVLLEPTSRGGSRHVHEQLEPGHLVGLGGPRNNFPLVPAESYLFVAGGIGITPILPMVEQAELLGADWRLLYGGRQRGSMAFLTELSRYGDRVLVRPQDEHGLLDLPAFLGEPRPGTPVYSCGPAPLLAAMEAACAGWPARSLHVERFVAEDRGAPVRTTSFDVELHRSGRTVTVAPDVSVLEAVAAAGVEVLSSCRQGTCGTCETTVLAGVPDHRDSLLDDAERAAGDCMYPCVSRSCSDRLVLDL
ncbi:Phthalate 4,5-dioxygenase [Modestobacter italicus]|uniref:Phthalate 4,5-dioxygenase n=1 Tax=Modestobacter italicus (strain DSM 44449 / CECT 9708 / BC 501) TaxID=2732864 RepID=I4EXN9_MODI5|nr:PDR/VanB family oxidoreductase [Modestobacter marinus]CCH88152.1 Phthalate 4,5-dioxygenase [Modestobacter marinus]